MLQDKKIVLGVTGSIAAYKAAELTREFVKRGAAVRVIMTGNAAEFIAPLTFQTLSSNAVHSEMYPVINDYNLAHISLAEYADIMVIAPATANIIGKIAAGIADDLLTTTVMTTRAPVLICPAMNTNMYENAIVQENIMQLTSRGYLFMEPGYGKLACRSEGQGRLPEVSDIVEEVESILTVKDLGDERIIVTAGPTREPLDPVRYITNYSSGKMGYALAIAGRRRGARVVLISGPSALTAPRGVTFVSVSSAMEMKEAVMAHLKASTIVIKAAAVADYRPATRLASKMKKQAGPLTLSLERNPDIIAEIGKKKGKRILVGFAVETENLIENARAKLIDKNMDLIVANDVTQAGAGFGYDTNIIKILDRNGGQVELPMMDKIAAADRILDRVKDIIAEKGRK
ncbi:MAG: bifunctional phosphopantothenoylcysteine decarboxylase/phosphopantothenate--cysteine ligase CoaBC [Deltaproteobacteria bacterium]|nr:bifunctional phosphopantothenoylcysteine decarboxylase/phosphopantothenate--cysteine ligase CoaBC [Deltaproteobacteria bacterium]